jgi:hypothetical protein
MDIGMRGISLGALAVTAALLAPAASAGAHTTELQGDMSATGAVTVTWHGDPARGCAAAGLCGYSGSVGIQSVDGGYDFILAGGRRLRDGYGYLDTASSPIVRVKRAEGTQEGGCVDTPPGFTLDLTTARAGANRTRLGLDAEGLSSGRCAGPGIRRVVALLPRRALSLSRLKRAPQAVDMSGEVPFKSGHFSGVVRSTLRLRLARPGAGGTDIIYPHRRPPRDHRKRVRVVHLHAVYRVQRFAGTLTASFGGLADPGCTDFDACGLTGSSSWSLDSGRGAFVFDVYTRARRSDRGLRGALRAIGRGRALVEGDGDPGRVFGHTVVDLTRPDGAPCHDTARVSPPGVSAYSVRAGRVHLEFGGDANVLAGGELLRTECPGPRDEDILGPDVIATGSMPAAFLARRSITARLRDRRAFKGHGYSGTENAGFTVGLRRVSARAKYLRVRGGV